MARKIQTKSTAPEVKGAKGKRILALILMAACIVGLMFLASYLATDRQELVSVIRLTTSKLAGTELTLADVEECQIPKSVYDQLGVVTVKDENGNDRNEQIFIPYSQLGSIIDLNPEDDEQGFVVASYLANYKKIGSILTSYDLTHQLEQQSPWLATMGPEDELFTMELDTSTIDVRYLFPGSRLRARLVNDVPTDVVPAIRDQIKQDEIEHKDDIVRDSTYQYNQDIASAIEQSGSNTSVPVAEVVIEDIIVNDMTNAAGESIYDLYMSLLKLPINERIHYLQTTMGDNEIALAWRERVTPVAVTFILDRESAGRLTEYEKSGGTIKYTILKDDPNSEGGQLMSQFIELSNQINSTLTEE